MEENPDKILSGIVENCKIANPQCDNMAAILIFLKKGELKAWKNFKFNNRQTKNKSKMIQNKWMIIIFLFCATCMH